MHCTAQRGGGAGGIRRVKPDETTFFHSLCNLRKRDIFLSRHFGAKASKRPFRKVLTNFFIDCLAAGLSKRSTFLADRHNCRPAKARVESRSQALGGRFALPPRHCARPDLTPPAETCTATHLSSTPTPASSAITWFLPLAQCHRCYRCHQCHRCHQPLWLAHPRTWRRPCRTQGPRRVGFTNTPQCTRSTRSTRSTTRSSRSSLRHMRIAPMPCRRVALLRGK